MYKFILSLILIIATVALFNPPPLSKAEVLYFGDSKFHFGLNVDGNIAHDGGGIYYSLEALKVILRHYEPRMVVVQLMDYENEKRRGPLARWQAKLQVSIDGWRKWITRADSTPPKFDSYMEVGGDRPKVNKKPTMISRSEITRLDKAMDEFNLLNYGIPLVQVMMPLRSGATNVPDYIFHGAIFVDLSSLPIPYDAFYDEEHLNAKGAEIVTEYLLSKL